MTYKLDNINVSTYGALPITDEYLAISGLFDMPKRNGTTEQSWGTSIEPYVDALDIEYSGRDLSIRFAFDKNSQFNFNTFMAALQNCTTLTTDLGAFSVICKDDIQVEDFGKYSLITVKLYQDIFVFDPLTFVPNNSGDYRVNGFGFNQFGIIVSEKKGEKTIAQRIDVGTTESYTKTQYRQSKSIDIDCQMVGTSISDLYAKMRQLQAVISTQSMKSLKVHSSYYSVYFKNGISAKVESDKLLKFTLKAVINA